MEQRPPLTQSHWTADPSQALLEITLGDLLRRLAREVPERVAFVEAVADAGARRRWTYRQLLEDALQVAAALLRRHRPGDRIAVWAPNCAQWVLLQHGASLAGMVLVTVNPAYVADEVRHVLAASGASAIFHADRYRDCDMTAVVAQLRHALPELRQAVPFPQWDRFVADGRGLPSALPEVRPGDMVQIQFTSGTTGRPKGACLHHRGIVNAARFAAQRAGFPDGGVWATAMPLFHVGGCAGSQIGAMSSRGTFVLQPAFDAGAMLEIIESEKVEHLHAVPTMVLALLDHPERPARRLGSLRMLMSGGSPVPAALVERARRELGCRFTITFGQTELNGVVSQTSPDDTLERQTASIGRPASQAELKIADPDTGAVRPLGEAGEVWVRGYQTMLGYFDSPEATAETLVPDGWLRTGDLASMDAQGYLRIEGRLKDCIIRGGENIYPREIENVLLAHPRVRQACVVGAADARWGEVVAAVIECEGGQAPSTLELHHHCRRHLAPYKTPGLWFFVDRYPTTSSGKVQKYLLREWIAQKRLVPEAFDKPAARRSQLRVQDAGESCGERSSRT
ncbi:AMP-binding protein [Variovorax guangxiensis]|uniref:class I adenylate-forming enzyme family protein n=1 Tax=Variovorax guangxiensis TaxID=1775474 RepID=UPI0028576AE1|nr:AMP-binding protein [Variovorax guangxiensis]MDR6855872.1 fatty-acyl-CoA synthase [Variovorax guangxiensis]